MSTLRTNTLSLNARTHVVLRDGTILCTLFLEGDALRIECDTEAVKIKRKAVRGEHGAYPVVLIELEPAAKRTKSKSKGRSK